MTKKKSKSPISKKPAKPTSKSRGTTKSAPVINLLERSSGASIQEMVKATGWKAHSVRGFMAGSLKRQGKAVTSDVNELGERHYKLARAL